MSIRKNKNQQQSVNQRRKLRSSAKVFEQSSTLKLSPSNQKDSESNQSKIDHIYNNNASISTYPVFEDTKIAQELVPQKQYPLEISKKNISVNKKQSMIQNVSLNQNNQQISYEQLQNSLEIELNSRSLINENSFNKQPKLSTPNSKSHLKIKSFLDESIYHSQKVSYRKKKTQNITSVPIRKCVDPFELKIVSWINKLFYDKINLKQIEILCDKIQKISNKDMFNPFVVSGIQTILTMLELKGPTHVTTMNKLKNQVKNLTTKIWNELGKTDDYQSIQIQEKNVPIDDIKPKMIRKVYKYLIKIKKQDSSKARQNSYKICEQFFNKNQSVKQADIMEFFNDYQFFTP